MLKKWLKKIIIEAVKESFSPINIEVKEREDYDYKLPVIGGVFNYSKISIHASKNVLIDKCVIRLDEGKTYKNFVEFEE